MRPPKKTGLYFGTFNPVHIGHLNIANYMVAFSDLDEVWMVVTPHNPHKKKKTLLEDHHRLGMVRMALEDYPKIRASNVEFYLAQPNYTINTLLHLEEKHPGHQFSLIMGGDNLRNLHKWKNADVLVKNYPIYVYPRIPGTIENTTGTPPVLTFEGSQNIQKIEAPIMQLSSTFIRRAIKEGKDIRPMLPEAVWRYVDEMHFYR